MVKTIRIAQDREFLTFFSNRLLVQLTTGARRYDKMAAIANGTNTGWRTLNILPRIVTALTNSIAITEIEMPVRAFHKVRFWNGLGEFVDSFLSVVSI